MTRRFVVRPLAEADLEDAARWYDEERGEIPRSGNAEADRRYEFVRECLEARAS
jgi:plasmid stabilization system protein ParE